MKRPAGRRAGWRGEGVPAEVDLSGLSVERARFALGRLREAVAARKGGGEGAPDFLSLPRAAERWVVRTAALLNEGGGDSWRNPHHRTARPATALLPSAPHP